MIHISAPFYPKEVRELVRKLKSEDKLREKPLFGLDISLFAAAVLICFLFFFFKVPISPKSIFLVLVFFLIIAKCIVTDGSKIIILHSIGVEMDGVIYTEPYFITFSRGSGGWYFEYRIIDERFPDSLKQKSYEARILPFKGLPDTLRKAGAELKILVDPNLPDRNSPLFLKESSSSSLVKDPIEENLNSL